MEALQASALPLGYATKIPGKGSHHIYTECGKLKSTMFLSVQAEGMGGVNLPYPLDSISAYHQPAIRTSLGSRLDLEGANHLLGWGINWAFTPFLAVGATTHNGKLEGGTALSIASHTLGVSLRNEGWALGYFGESGWKVSWGVIYQQKNIDLGIAIHPHPSLTLATQKNRVGLEWRPSSLFALRMGYSIRHGISCGATYSRFSQEFSFFFSTEKKLGVAAGIKW